MVRRRTMIITTAGITGENTGVQNRVDIFAISYGGNDDNGGNDCKDNDSNGSDASKAKILFM